MANPGDFASTVKQQADIVRIIGEYVTLKKAGAQNFSGLCPFHSEKTASFSVHATRQFYHCFGCSASGDVFSFVQKIENVTFPEAVRIVAQKMGIAMPKVQFNSPEEAREAKSRGVLLDLNEAACVWFEQQLKKPEGAAAREYLKGRGLDAEAIARFRIGFAPESGFMLLNALKGKADEEMLRASGLFAWKDRETTNGNRGPSTAPLRGSAQDDISGGNGGGETDGQTAGGTAPSAQKAALYSKFRNRVMFPICSEQGKVIAFTGRTLSTDEKAGPKYLNSPETAIYQKSRVLYNLHLAKEAIRKLDYVILVEGQMDCISVFNAGFNNVIASSGTAFTEIQARLLARLTKKIVVNFDPDAAGVNAAERSLDMLVSEGFSIKVLRLDQGYDPDLLIRKRGTNAYSEALKSCKDYFEFLCSLALQRFPGNSADARANAMKLLKPRLEKVSDLARRIEISADIAKRLNVDNSLDYGDLKRALLKRAKDPDNAFRFRALDVTALTDSERVLLRALAGGDELILSVPDENGREVEFNPGNQARFTLSAEHLHVGLASETVIDALLDPANHGVDPMSLPLGESEKRMLAAALLREDEAITPELMHGAIESLRRRKVEIRQRELKAEISEAERTGDQKRLAELLQEKLAVDKKLR